VRSKGEVFYKSKNSKNVFRTSFQVSKNELFSRHRRITLAIKHSHPFAFVGQN